MQCTYTIHCNKIIPRLYKDKQEQREVHGVTLFIDRPERTFLGTAVWLRLLGGQVTCGCQAEVGTAE